MDNKAPNEEHRIWTPKHEADQWRQMVKEANEEFMAALCGFPKPDIRTDEQKKEDRIKMAFVFINGENRMLGVDNETMVGYALTGNPQVKKPLEVVRYDSFNRWCRGMDL